MRGSIKATGKDSWQITVDTGAPVDGKRQKRYVTVHGKKPAAQAKLNELLIEHDKFARANPGHRTIADLLTEWLSSKTKVSIRSMDAYAAICNVYLIPALGAVKLKDLTDQHIQDYYTNAHKKGLSNRTVHSHHCVIFQSLKFGVKHKYIGHNPAEDVEAPSAKGKEMRYLQAFEVEALLEAATDDTYYPVIYVALNTGMRQAELLALRWRDVDLLLLQIQVSRSLLKRKGVITFPEPKTKHSKRTIAMTPSLALYLGKHLEAQTDLFNTLGRRLTADDLIFNNEGEALPISTVSHAFHRLTIRAGFKGLRFHDLRHTFAHLMLERGANPLVVSKCLGHNSVAFTLDTYGHFTKEMQIQAMALLDGIMPAGVVPVNSGIKLYPVLLNP